jgi:hypothetical protein
VLTEGCYSDFGTGGVLLTTQECNLPELAQKMANGKEKCVDRERERLKSVERTPAATEQGKALQRELGASAAYVDALVDQAASKHLKKFKPGDSVKPS